MQEIITDPNESDGFQWVDLEEFYKQPQFTAIAPKVKRFLAENRIIWVWLNKTKRGLRLLNWWW